VTKAIVDDHLLRDLLTDDASPGLRAILADHEPATTNLYLHRLCRSAASSSGGALTGSWSEENRRALAAQLLALPSSVEVVPMMALAPRMAEIASVHRVSTLGAEAVAAAERMDAPLCVWVGDDGPGIRSAMVALGLDVRTVAR
jgi:hypothetical protein